MCLSGTNKDPDNLETLCVGLETHKVYLNDDPMLFLSTLKGQLSGNFVFENLGLHMYADSKVF